MYVRVFLCRAIQCR